MRIQKVNYKSFLKIFSLIAVFAIVSNLLINLYILGIDHSSKSLSVQIYDKDRTYLSSQLADTIKSKNKGTIIYKDSEGIESLSKGKSNLFVIINNGFEEKMKNGDFSNIISVYTEYNPKQSKTIINTISKEVLKQWTNLKIKKDNKGLNIKIDWNQFEGKDVGNIYLREVIVVPNSKGNVSEIKSNKADVYKNRNDIKVKLNIAILFLGVNLLLFLFSKRIMEHKLSGLKDRINLFKFNGRTFYRDSFLSFLILVAIESCIIYGGIFAIYGASFNVIVTLLLRFLIYEVAVTIITNIFLRFCKTMPAFNVFNTLFAMMCVLIILTWIVI